MIHDKVPSRHSKQVTIIERTGAAHSVFSNKLIISNRLTSFDRRFTTLPGAVSPSAVCDNRNDWKTKKWPIFFSIRIGWRHLFTLLFDRWDCKWPLALSSHYGIHSWTIDLNKLFVSHWTLKYQPPKAKLCGMSSIDLICVRKK